MPPEVTRKVKYIRYWVSESPPYELSLASPTLEPSGMVQSSQWAGLLFFILKLIHLAYQLIYQGGLLVKDRKPRTQILKYKFKSSVKIMQRVSVVL